MRLEQFSRRYLELQVLPRLLYRIEMDQDSQEIVKTVREQLKENPVNVVIYFNHLAYGDPLFAAHIAEKIAPSHSHHVISPASYSHTNPDNPKNKAFFELVKEAKRLGIEIHRVIQLYQVDHPDFGYTKAQATEQNMKFMHRLRQLRQTNQPVICILSPEGHRSESGSLIQAERGIELIGGILAPVLYLPVGITYPDGYERDKINFGRKVSLTVGTPIMVTHRGVNVSADSLMKHLSSYLPPDMYGYYADTFLSPS